MGIDDVTRIRDRSAAYKLFKRGKIKSTPWETDFDEMAKKTVARRHSKVLPMSTDLDDLMRRDDALYNFEGKSDVHAPEKAVSTISAKLDALAAGPDTRGIMNVGAEHIEHDAETGEVIGEHTTHDVSGAGEAAEAKIDDRAALIEAGQNAATGGSAAFQEWWKALTDAERALIGSGVGSLLAGAKLRD